MKKIIELLIKKDDIELAELGVDILSIVENPAIGVNFFAFSEQEFVDPNPGESESDYIGRCVPVLVDEGYDTDQALAICYSSYSEENENFLDENPCQSGWVAYGLKPKNGRMVPNCVPVENAHDFFVDETFESYDDYPQSVKDAAARGIRLNEEQGNKCATQTGKVRAQQLAQGKPISLETVKRMYSYLSRAATYYDPSDTEACGTISYLLWGGESALGWSERLLKKVQEEQMAETIEKMAEELGEEHDVTMTTYISEKNFAEEGPDTVAQIGDALKALDLLGRRDSREEAKTVYKYEGPQPQRRFCRALINASRNKFFTREQINEMRAGLARFNPGMGRGGRDNYDIFKFGGGVNCRHFFQQYKMFKGDNGRTLLIQTNNRTVPMSQRPNGGRVNASAIPDSKLNKMQFQVTDEEQRIVVGPAMIPQSLIPRRSKDGEEYFVYFSKETIRNISEKFFSLNHHNNTDVNHDEEVTTQNTLLESWIVEDAEIDKSRLYGYEPIEGSWFVSYRINDDETWDKIKKGELRGWSISGNFLEKEV